MTRKVAARCAQFAKGCLGIIIFLLIIGCKEQIVHNLNEQDANRLITKLADANIDAEKAKQPDGQWAIAVANNDALDALRFLDGARLFKASTPLSDEAGTLMSSREDQLFKYERALSREIEETLASLNGVLQARVHLNLPPTDPLFGQPLVKDRKGSASVLLITDQKFHLAKEPVAELVAGASGLEASKISVLFGGAGEVGEMSVQSVPVSAINIAGVEHSHNQLQAGENNQESVLPGIVVSVNDSFGWLVGNQLLLLKVGFGFCGIGLMALAWLFLSRRRASF